MTRIVVISDTHARSLERLPQGLVRALADADWVVHCGDYTSIALLRELQSLSRRFVGVYGNVDPMEIREELPHKAVFELEGRQIGVIHPAWGGPPFGIEEDIATEFSAVDLILFGHTHEPCHKRLGDVIFLNPGQAYPSFRSPASLAVVTLGQRSIEVDIRAVE